MNSGVEVVKQFQTELLSPLITKLLEKVEKRMSGCHIPNCLSPCCHDLLEQITLLEGKVKENWNVTYKRDESFGKRIIKLEEQIKTIHNDLKCVSDWMREKDEDEGSDHDERIDDLENIGAEARLIKIEKWMNQESLSWLKNKVNDFKQDTGKTDRWMECLVGLEDKMKSRIDDLEELIYEVKEKQRACDRKPHPCPICEGNGFVIQEDVSQGEADCYKRVECKACEGNCIVWG